MDFILKNNQIELQNLSIEISNGIDNSHSALVSAGKLLLSPLSPDESFFVLSLFPIPWHILKDDDGAYEVI